MEVPDTVDIGTLIFFLTPFTDKEGDALQGRVLWESSDPSIVSIDAAGKAEALKKGTATITAVYERVARWRPNFSYSQKVHVVFCGGIDEVENWHAKVEVEYSTTRTVGNSLAQTTISISQNSDADGALDGRLGDHSWHGHIINAATVANSKVSGSYFRRERGAGFGEAAIELEILPPDGPGKACRYQVSYLDVLTYTSTDSFGETKQITAGPIGVTRSVKKGIGNRPTDGKSWLLEWSEMLPGRFGNSPAAEANHGYFPTTAMAGDLWNLLGQGNLYVDQAKFTYTFKAR